MERDEHFRDFIKILLIFKNFIIKKMNFKLQVVQPAAFFLRAISSVCQFSKNFVAMSPRIFNNFPSGLS